MENSFRFHFCSVMLSKSQGSQVVITKTTTPCLSPPPDTLQRTVEQESTQNMPVVYGSFRLVEYLAQISGASNSSSSSPRGSSASEPIPTLYTYLHSPQAPLDKECYYRRKHQQSSWDTESWSIRVCLHQLMLGKTGVREGDVWKEAYMAGEMSHVG